MQSEIVIEPDLSVKNGNRGRKAVPFWSVTLELATRLKQLLISSDQPISTSVASPAIN